MSYNRSAYDDPAIDGQMRQLQWCSIKDGLSPAFVEAVKKHYVAHQW